MYIFPSEEFNFVKITLQRECLRNPNYTYDLEIEERIYEILIKNF
jgi:hypothetical protein